uniref:TBC1 domain family member 13 n=1 Tax=Lygus hesperus TaxID=30085 RepID=A0A0A9Z9J9_LYGHE
MTSSNNSSGGNISNCNYSNSISNSALTAIDMDVPRTMPKVRFFGSTTENSYGCDSNCNQSHYIGLTSMLTTASQGLHRVLTTIATVNAGLGYVQGMNELAAHLMYVFAEGTIDKFDLCVEADTFFCLQTLLSHLGDDFCRELDADHEMGMLTTLRHYEHVLQFFDK